MIGSTRLVDFASGCGSGCQMFHEATPINVSITANQQMYSRTVYVLIINVFHCSTYSCNWLS